jgi:hypothetical protein
MTRFNSNRELLSAAHKALDGLSEDDGGPDPLTRDEAADCFVAAFMAFAQDASEDFGMFGDVLVEVALLGAEMSVTLKGE